MGRTSLPALQARLGRGLSPTIVTWNVVEYRQAAERHVTGTVLTFLCEVHEVLVLAARAELRIPGHTCARNLLCLSCSILQCMQCM